MCHLKTITVASAIFLSVFFGVEATSSPRKVADRVVDSHEQFWQRIQKDPVEGTYTSRRLFRYALALGEADRQLDRLNRVFELAERMQQRNPDKPGYGNFYWYSNRPEVKDRNAVDFCMESATVLWLRHREKLDEKARERLRELMEYAVEGCLRHRVGATYTNIALMNAGNLIRLGEGLDRPDVAKEGYERFKNFGWYTWQHGLHEFASATYYRVDMTTLQLIARFSQRQTARNQARALLKLMWTDVAANWFPPATRLAGPNSRTYDFLYNRGGIRRLLNLRGWSEPDPNTTDLLAAYGRWTPDHETLAFRNRYPRLVRASWGRADREARTHMVHQDVTLGSSGAQYHAMDVPMTVDLPGGAERVRGYFIPDGRNDPYGLNPYDIGSGHEKARHLRPFWTAAQRRDDALGVCVYRLDAKERQELKTLKSHFVLPRGIDGAWLGEQRVLPRGNNTFSTRRLRLRPGRSLVLREGSAAVGIRVPVARREDGSSAPVRFVDRSLTVEAESGDVHGSFQVKKDKQGARGGAYVDSGPANGGVRITLNVQEAGTYPLWGRVIAPDGKSNSFHVRITQGDKTILPRSTWHIGPTESWRLRSLEPNRNEGPVHLPEGKVTVELMGREDGTLIDSLRVGDPRAVRLSVDHTAGRRTEPGAVGLWVRVGSGLEDEQAFRRWRRTFREADLTKEVSDKELNIRAPGTDGTVEVNVEQPWKKSGRVALTPLPSTSVLSINGEDVGRDILASVPRFKRMEQAATPPDPFPVKPNDGTTIEVEKGGIVPAFNVEKDGDAFGGRCVTAGSVGAVKIPLDVRKAGDYYLWGRVLAPDGKTDSFYLRIRKDQETLVSRHAWHTGRSKEWRWSPVKLRNREPARRIHLPEGEVMLELLARENGTRIDRIFLSPDPDAGPK